MAVFIDVAVFFTFLIAVLVIGIGMSRRGKGSSADSESYFLAGRGLAWWIIGVSLIAANISTEQFVGMSGNAADYIGLAVASYEWIAALSLVIVAFIFLPRFLKAGVYTIPQFLETRYNKATRTLVSLTMIVILICVNITAIVYSGSKFYSEYVRDLGLSTYTLFGNEIQLGLVFFCWLISILAVSYVFVGGLKACAWADLLQGSALILCGCLILYFAMGALKEAPRETLSNAIQANVEQVPTLAPDDDLLDKLDNEESAYQRFAELNSHKLRMNLPWKDSFLPITALLFAIWIPNLYYWGLNQYIMQRTLGAQSLSQGQKGIIFAASLKLLIPFIVIFPGIIAFNLYNETMRENAVKEVATKQITEDGKTVFVFDEEKFTALAETYKQSEQLFTFNEKFVRHHPDIAMRMVEFNFLQTGLMSSADAEYDVVDSMPPLIHSDLTLLEPMEALNILKAELSKQHGFWNQPKYGHTFTDYDYDSAFSLLARRLTPPGGLQGFMLAAVLGMIVSTLASMYNAVSTIFTMDIYKEYLHRKASEKTLVMSGRITVMAAMLIGCCVAPVLADPRFGGLFWFIQEFQGFISPGVLAAFLFGFLVRKAPRSSGLVALILNPIIYGSLMLFASDMSFLNRMAITFLSIIAVMTLMTILKPLKEPFKLESATSLDLRWSKSAVVLGLIVAAITIALYAHFWDYSTPMFEGLWSFGK